jgi:hypothetical protein
MLVPKKTWFNQQRQQTKWRLTVEPAEIMAFACFSQPKMEVVPDLNDVMSVRALNGGFI